LAQTALYSDEEDSAREDYDMDNDTDFLPETVQFIPSSIPEHVYNDILSEAWSWNDADTMNKVVFWGEFDEYEDVAYEC
jgi:hypothetical protein